MNKENFKRLKDCVYLDHSGSALYSEKQIESVFQDLKNNLLGNPHSRNSSSTLMADIIDQTRLSVVEHFGTNLDEYDVIFTSGATASLKMVAESFDFSSISDEKCRNGKLFYLIDNHTSVIGMREVASSRGFEAEALDPKSVGSKMASSKTPPETVSSLDGDNLFVYPAESNFSGDMYPLDWIRKIQQRHLSDISETNNGRWFCLLDAACFASTNYLDLQKYKPDYVCISFYKLFGYPTGLGALLVRNSSARTLKKTYFGGGTVSMSISQYRYHVCKESLHERFEDGTLPFLSIASLKQGFGTLKDAGGIEEISRKTFELARYVYRKMSQLKHINGNSVAEIYSQSNFEDPNLQGGILTFNLKRPNGDYIGYSEVEEMANIHNIQLRTGCFCNTGACQTYLNLTANDLMKHYEAGHVCGDKISIIDGKPTGAVRISFGYSSTKNDADAFLRMVQNCFVIFKENDTIVDEKKIKEEGSVTIVDICIFPVKSCKGQHVTEWPINENGLKYDRNWVIVDSNGVVLTVKREPKLYTIEATVDLKESLLYLCCKGFEPITIPLTGEKLSFSESSMCTSKVCGKKILGLDCGERVAKWIDNVLDRIGCRLLSQAPPNKDGIDISNYANSSKFTLISQKSVDWLSGKLLHNGFLSQEEIEAGIWRTGNLSQRFRSNFVVGGMLEEFVEETWHQFSFSTIIFQSLKPCSRCQVIGYDQDSNKRFKEPLRTLAFERGQLMPFGINFTRKSIDETITSVGDSVSIMSYK